jgi:guanylate kinase
VDMVCSGEYQPSPEALERLGLVDFVAVVGPCCCGKSTLIARGQAWDSRLRLVLNNTSRAPRPEEVPGVDFRFETRDRMLERIASREYAQVAPNAFGDLYATLADDYPVVGVGLLPVLAEAVAVFRALPFKSFRVVYVLPPDVATWRQRLAVRGWGAGTLGERLGEAGRSLAFALAGTGCCFVVNDVLERATDDFVALVLGDVRGFDPAGAKVLAARLLRDIRDIEVPAPVPSGFGASVPGGWVSQGSGCSAVDHEGGSGDVAGGGGQ